MTVILPVVPTRVRDAAALDIYETPDGDGRGRWQRPEPVEVSQLKLSPLYSADFPRFPERKVEGQGQRNKLCLARVLVLSILSFKWFEFN